MLENYPIDNFTRNEREVLNTLRSKIKYIEKFEIESLSKECYTSISSISRIYKKLGFVSYLEFKYFLIQEKQKCNIENVNYDVNLISSIDDLFTNKYNNDIETLSTKIKLSAEIYIVAVGQSKLIAKYLQKNFELLGISIYIISESHMISKLPSLIHDSTLLIVISTSGSTSSVIQPIVKLSQRILNENTFLITSNSTSSLACEIRQQIILG
ncbi:MAG: MurR/RpiR family transcriptional regulator [Erysipelotrichaceae bacterium]